MVDLFLDDVLVEHLFIELEWLGFDQLVVEPFPHWLNNVALFEIRVLLTKFGWADEFLFEFEFVLERVVDVADEALGRRAEEAVYALIVELLHLLVEHLPVHFAPLQL